MSKLINVLFFIEKLSWKIKTQSAPVLVVGCGHSGTTLLAKIIASHSSFYAIKGESGFAVDSNYYKTYTNIIKFRKDTIKNGAKRWVEKTPAHIRYLSSILSNLKGIKIVAITRDPRDVVNSLKKRYGILEVGIERWQQDNTFLIPNLQNRNLKIIKYENLIASPKNVVEEVMNFLGEKFEENQLEYHKNQENWFAIPDGASVTPKLIEHINTRNTQINSQIFDGRNKWIKELSESDKLEIQTRLSCFAKSIGYDLK